MFILVDKYTTVEMKQPEIEYSGWILQERKNKARQKLKKPKQS
jgi:hypothetical protein